MAHFLVEGQPLKQLVTGPGIYCDAGIVKTGEGDRRVRVDAFGNVNYGLMLASYGIREDEAILASNAGTADTGRVDRQDDVAISHGYKMASMYPDGVPLFAIKR